MIRKSKSMILRWFQDETDVPKNKRKSAGLLVMNSGQHTYPAEGILYVSRRTNKVDVCFWIHRCSHKVSKTYVCI